MDPGHSRARHKVTYQDTPVGSNLKVLHTERRVCCPLGPRLLLCWSLPHLDQRTASLGAPGQMGQLWRHMGLDSAARLLSAFLSHPPLKHPDHTELSGPPAHLASQGQCSAGPAVQTPSGPDVSSSSSSRCLLHLYIPIYLPVSILSHLCHEAVPILCQDSYLCPLSMRFACVT